MTATGSASFDLRVGEAADHVCVSALAIQVFLDTYATEGIRPDLAREAFTEYSPAQFKARLADPARSFFVAERAGHLVAFAELLAEPTPPDLVASNGWQLVRLYVQPAFQRQGLGRALLLSAEELAAENVSHLWLTTWVGNSRARAFYAAQHYQDVGATMYKIQGQAYENRVLMKSLHGDTAWSDLN